MDEFFTFREYMLSHGKDLTPSMEDYMEMIFRLSKETGFTRINELADALNVRASSVSRMIQKLAESGYVDYQKYGVVALSEEGKKIGERLLLRHNLSEEFLRILGVTENVLEETEKIEHTLSPHTLQRIASFVAFFKKKPKLLEEYKSFYNKYFK